MGQTPKGSCSSFTLAHMASLPPRLSPWAPVLLLHPGSSIRCFQLRKTPVQRLAHPGKDVQQHQAMFSNRVRFIRWLEPSPGSPQVSAEKQRPLSSHRSTPAPMWGWIRPKVAGGGMPARCSPYTHASHPPGSHCKIKYPPSGHTPNG